MTFVDKLEVLRTKFEALKPELEVTVKDETEGVEGYVVVWNTKISENGPLHKCGKGGTRIHDKLSMDEVKMLAKTMALKNAAAGLPLGGSKSGLKADPKSAGFEKKYRRFVDLCRPYLHENGGVFGGFGFDIGADPIHAHWACDELGSTRSFTGKSPEMGGTDYDREGIAGLGVAVSAKTVLEESGKSAQGASFAVQGIGAMGAAVIRYFSEYGGVLNVVSDPRLNGTWKLKDVPTDELINALSVQDIRVIKSCLSKEATQISDSSDDPLYADVDVAFPCAVQNVITSENVDRIKASFLVEGANNPTYAHGYAVLARHGVYVVPDFIANPGGVIAAFVELTSDSSEKAEEAKDMTRSKISMNVKEMVALAKEHNVLPRDAGLFLAYSRVFTEVE